MVDFGAAVEVLREANRNHEDPDVRRRQENQDALRQKREEVRVMPDVTFVQYLEYYIENSSGKDSVHAMERGDTPTYDTVLHFVMYPEMVQRLDRLVPDQDKSHHFICGTQTKPHCDSRCQYKEPS